MKNKKNLDSNKILVLLGLLKDTSVQYPPELLAARRAGFVEQIKGAQSTIKGETSGSQIFGVSTHALEVVLGYVLAGMIVVLIATLGYVYQDELRDLLIDDVTPDVQIVDTTLPPPQPTVIDTPSDTATLPPTTAPVLVTSDPKEEQPATADSIEEPPLPTQPAATQPPPTKPGERIGHTKTPKPENKDTKTK